MKLRSIVFLSLLMATLFVSCKSSSSKKAEEPKMDTTKKIAVDTTSSVKEKQVIARFDEFSLGDALHFMFTDESGAKLDFGGNEDTVYKFAEELPANKANSTNQGWTFDKKLQGKMFAITYITRTQPLYLDGPMGEVLIITKATLKE